MEITYVPTNKEKKYRKNRLKIANSNYRNIQNEADKSFY